ncbi:MAG: CdaR family protein [Brevinema sp.]
MKFWLKLFYSIFIKDFIPKIISVLLGSFFWYYVTVLSIEKTYINMPIEVINTPDGTSVEYNKNTNIKVELLAREDLSSYLSRIKAVVDLSDATKGKRQYPIILQNLPSGINYYLNPKMIMIELDDIISNTIPIMLEIVSNNNNNNKNILTYKLTPDKITVIGSAKKIKSLNSIKTETFNADTLENLKFFTTNIKLRIPTSITTSPDISIISMEGQIESYDITNKVFLPVTVQSLKPSLGIVAIPSVQFTTLTKESNIERLLLETEVTINFSNITNSGVHTVPIAINAPVDLKFLNPPSNITLLIEDDPELSFEAAGNFTAPININNQLEETNNVKDPLTTNETLK